MDLERSAQPNPPDDPRDSVAAYGIGAANREESLEVRRLLTAEPALRRDAAEYATAATMLNASVPRVEPPAALKSKILSAARASRPAPLTVLPKPERRAPRLRDVIAFVASAAAVVLLALNLYWMAQVSEMRQSPPAALPNRGMEMAVALLMAPDSHRVDLMDDGGDRIAMVMFSDSHSEALMVTHNLPSLDGDRMYQLWQIDADGKPMSAGVFEPAPSGMHAMIFTPPMPWQTVDALVISVEPEGGSEAPSTPPMVVGTMST